MKSENNPLGQETTYPSVYSPELLFPIERKISRELLGIANTLPFYGVDIWTAYELSWLNSKGKPVVAMGEFTFPCSSQFMVESKSFKLYLNSFNQTRFESSEQVKQKLQDDLSNLVNDKVEVTIFNLNKSPLQEISVINGKCLDEIDIEVSHYHPQPELLTCAMVEVSEVLYSHLLKTNCPVTGQPDWATIVIEYHGNQINHEKLLTYIVSFREHQDFHEHCVERIFCDISQRCKPESLSVFARYTRRGGLDINPSRHTNNFIPSFQMVRLVRQ